MRSGSGFIRGVALVAVLLAAGMPLLGASPAGASSKASATPSPTFPEGSGTETPEWTFKPCVTPSSPLVRSSIHMVAKAGKVDSTCLDLLNESTVPLSFDVYPSDAYNTVTGGFSLYTPKAPKVGVGTWIHLPVNIRDLPPHTSDDFQFSVHIPLNVAPGDHAGGVVALNVVSGSKTASGATVTIQHGEGVAVYVRVPGALHAGAAVADIGGSLSTPALGFGSSWDDEHFKVVNTGNVLLSGKVQAEAVNLFGTVVKKWKPVPVTALIPNQSMTVTEPRWSGLPFIGPVHIKVTVITAAHATGEATFWVFPWLLVVLVIVVIIGLVLLLGWRRRRRSRETTSPSPEVGPGEPGEARSEAPATVG